MSAGFDSPLIAWATGLWGAVVGYIRSRGEDKPYAIASFALHCVAASFAAWLVWLACRAAGVDDGWIAVYTGLAGYLGPESIKPLEARFVAAITGAGKP